MPHFVCVVCCHTGSNPRQCSECRQPFSKAATGFDFQPLPTGDVLIEFHGDDGKTINTQVITREALARLPVIVRAFFLAVEEGKDAALAFLDGVTTGEGGR